jgi:uncharacterized protein involved in response to NO
LNNPLEKPETPVLLSYAFRPFFLLVGLFAIFAMLVWLMTWRGIGLHAVSPLWHGHEMLIGFVMAAVAGFSLTAVANWTGRPAVHGMPLALLISCWFVGRAAMLFTDSLSAAYILVLDSLFPVLLGFLLGKEIISGRNRRNYPLIVVMTAVGTLNLVYHLGAGGWIAGGERLAIYLLIHILLFLVTFIAGRIVPVFSANWLRQQGQTRMPVNNDLVNKLALIMTLLVGLTASFIPMNKMTGVLAFTAAVVHAYRLSQWRGLATRSNPLLFVLHAAYLWLPIGYTLLGCAVFGWLFTATAALHALTMGAIGSMILAVTTRVGLGHTGRPLQAARATVLAYWLLMLAVVLRVLSPLSGNGYMLMIDLSAAGWILAFGIFIWVYWPILSRPRDS